MGVSLDKLHTTAAYKLDAANNPFNKVSLDKLHVTAAYRRSNGDDAFNRVSLDKLHVTAAYRGPAVGIGEAPGTSRVLGVSEVVLSQLPDADDLLNGWLNEADGTTLFASIAKYATNDATFIRGGYGASNDKSRVRVAASEFEIDDEAYVTYRYGKRPLTTTQSVDLTVRLVQGASTVIATWTHTDVSTTVAEVTQTLTAPQIASITNFNNLFLEFESTAY